MPRKRLVVCCDGTWNKAETQTSISRLADIVEPRGLDGIEQRCTYIEGVGASRFTRFRGGLFGVGLSDNIVSAYRWLVENYESGDEIFCFGFSRGAYTARSLCGLLGASGLLRPDDAKHVDDAFEYYRTKPGERPASKLHRRLEALDRHTTEERLSVRLLGVFDTVGSLGVPVPLLASLTQWRRVAFHDTALSPLIEHAYHALAVDERRGPFVPTLWAKITEDGKARRFDGSLVDQTVVQAWFPGVHSDVGGGYDDKRLADVPFWWMLAAAQRLDLHTDWNRLDEALDPDACATAHDSLSWGWKLAGWWPWIARHEARVVGNRARRSKSLDPITAPEALHAAVTERSRDPAGTLPRDQAPYRPRNIFNDQGTIDVDLPIIDTQPPFRAHDATG